jgi:AcrR family transcriptional regulator
MANPRDGLPILSDISPPVPLLDKRREAELTARQRGLLADIERIVYAEGFASLTMAALAARLRCSLRTLYAIAPGRDRLVLIVIDRVLWRVGRQAIGAIGDHATYLDMVRDYLRAASDAINGWTAQFARDFSQLGGNAHKLEQGHNEYLYEVTRAFVRAAVHAGEVDPVDDAAVARVMAGLGRVFTRPEVIANLRTSPKEAADTVLDVLVAGLRGKRASAGGLVPDVP